MPTKFPIRALDPLKQRVLGTAPEPPGEPEHPEEDWSPIERDWSQPFSTLRNKWGEVPVTQNDRGKTADLFQLSDEELVATWRASLHETSTGENFRHRGWFHTLYADTLRGKRVLDVGSGFGISSLFFALNGAHVTFLDLEQQNLQVIRRLVKAMGIEHAQFVHLENLDSLTDLEDDYDVIMALGSLHNAPISVMRPEIQELIRHLKVGGRWLQLAYPESRWRREGAVPFSRWGEKTDGAGTPWCEWYDLDKLLGLLSPATFEVVLDQEFHNGDFNWFDLRYLGSSHPVPPAPDMEGNAV